MFLLLVEQQSHFLLFYETELGAAIRIFGMEPKRHVGAYGLDPLSSIGFRKQYGTVSRQILRASLATTETKATSSW